MDKLYQELYLIYSQELLNLNIGYSYDTSVLNKMMDIVGAINMFQQHPCKKDCYKYLSMYYD